MKGIYFNKQYQKYHARYYYKGRYLHVGRFKSLGEALEKRRQFICNLSIDRSRTEVVK